jgi:starch synthase
VEQWFPELFGETSWIDAWADRRFREPNFTPMAVGIRCADMVNTVSPTYAREILLPSDPANGLYRGEGLEEELREIDRRGKLLGILNGCDYPEGRSAAAIDRRELLELMAGEVERWQAEPLLARIRSLQALAPTVLLTSVTRIVEQKLKILFQPTSRGVQAIKELLDLLEAVNGMYVVIGTGVSEYEALLASTARAHRRLVFLQGYSETIAQALYANGTAFLMPSSFEPCGIGQMIAMRDGQPCIAHAVGGLKDTVIDGVNGFTFSGATLREQADDCVATVKRAIGMARGDAEAWGRIVQGARTSRFTWAMSAERYSESMYG